MNTTGLCSQFYFLSQAELKIYTQKYAVDYRFVCRFLGMLLKSLHKCVQDSFSLASMCGSTLRVGREPRFLHRTDF